MARDRLHRGAPALPGSGAAPDRRLRPYRHLSLGDPLGAGEIGHVVVDVDGELCTCGNYGCLETVSSSRAILQHAQTLAQQFQSSHLNQLTSSPEEISLDTICQAIQAGDEIANQVIEDAGRGLGIAAANLVGILGRGRS